MPASSTDHESPTTGIANAANAARLRMAGVHKAFGTTKVLQGVTLEVKPGTTTVVLGPSGSGKSVLLRLIVGLLPIDDGEIWFDDTRVDSLSERDIDPIRSQIGFLFQLSALFDSMTVHENLAFPLTEHAKLARPAIRERVNEALELVDMAGSQGKYPAQLSGGQQRRIALARAIMMRPRMVLYDEPTTGLDPVRARGINLLINKLKRELSVTGIVVTHDLTSAEMVADQVVLLLDGRVRIAGTLAEVRASRDPEVRGFLTGRGADEIKQGDGS
ncbi:MAG: ABC transporter ATP-binding protein [Phycisphaerales bacterium]